MRVAQSDKPLCKLCRGEAKRVPREGPILVGYYVCCPKCGFTVPVLHDESGVEIVEKRDPFELTLSAPVTCLACRGILRIEGSELHFEEAGHV